MNETFFDVYNLLKAKSVEKKILAKNFYYKYLIVNNNEFTVEKGGGLYLDNSINYQKSNFLAKTYLKRNYLSGYSLNLSQYKFKSKYNKNCAFYMPFYKESIKRGFNKAASTISFEENGVTAILFVSAVKGGFKAYSSLGLAGFLPRSQFNRIFFSINSDLKFSIFSQTINKSFNLFWLLAKLSKIRIRSLIKSSKKRNKKKRYSNFVFVLKE